MEVVEGDDDLDSSNDPEKLPFYLEVLFIYFKLFRQYSNFKEINFIKTKYNIIKTDSPRKYFKSNEITLKLTPTNSDKNNLHNYSETSFQNHRVGC